MSQSYVGAPEHQCWGKRTYLKSSDAKLAARHAMTMHGGSKMCAYRCEHCGRFHIGHKPYQLTKRSARR